MKKLVLYVKLNSAVVQKWIKRTGSVLQRHDVLSAPRVPRDKRDYSFVPSPKRTLLLAGDFTMRREFLTSYLTRHFPSPTGQPLPTVLTPRDAELRAHCQKYGRVYNELIYDFAFYDPATHEIFILPELERLLGSKDEREWVVGVRFLAHEWFHGLRSASAYYPLEEGGAEIFADQVYHLITGVSHRKLGIGIYEPFSAGVMALARLVSPRSPFRWVLQSRTAGNQELWLKRQMESLHISPSAIDNVLQYKRVSDGADWLKAMRAALKEVK